MLSVSSLADGGAASNIGQSSNAAANLVFDGGTLRYTGASNASTDRLLTIGAGGGTFESSGTGTHHVQQHGRVAFTGSGNRTFTLTGPTQGTLGRRGRIRHDRGAMSPFSPSLTDPAGAEPWR